MFCWSRDRTAHPAPIGLVLTLLISATLCWNVPAEATEEAAPQPPPATEPLPVADFSKPMGPPDPFNRGTPRGCMYGFLSAAREGDYERAAEYLDLRRLQPEERALGPQLTRRLKVVLDQTLWVDLVNLSDSNAGAPNDDLPDWQDRLGDIETPEGIVTVLLQRVPREGDGVRIWKIAGSTVDQIPQLYAQFEPVWLEEWLPPFFFEHQVLDVALWKWLSLLGLLAGASLVSLLIAGRTAQLLGVLFTRKHESFDPRIVHLVRGPVRLGWTVILFAAGHRSLGLALTFAGALRYLEILLLVVAVAWWAFRLIDFGALVLRVRAQRRGNLGLLPVLVPGARFTKIVILLIGFLTVLGILGVNVSAALAGLGIGGLAVALAAQKTLENLIGGISLFADRPVRVGDFCRYGDQIGTVEEIGLRSTRVRSLERSIVSVPNADFAAMQLDNFAVRDRRLLKTVLQLRYETTPEQMRYLLAKLRELLLRHPKVDPDPARVRFVGYGSYSKDVEVFAYLRCQEQNDFLAIQEDILLRMEDIVVEAGTGFAFPSQTAYLTQDTGLDSDRGSEAEARVEEWRAGGKLPFPEFQDQERQQIEDTLDWPPEGSPNAREGAGDAGPDRSTP
jgi:MscS family membrane protein